MVPAFIRSTGDAYCINTASASARARPGTALRPQYCINSSRASPSTAAARAPYARRVSDAASSPPLKDDIRYIIFGLSRYV